MMAGVGKMHRTDNLERVSSFKRNEKRPNSSKTLRSLGVKGSILIPLIITMVIMASLGAGMVSLRTTSTFQQLSTNNRARAYYVAESGGRYAMAKIREAYAQATTAARDAVLGTIPGTYYDGTAANNKGSFVISALSGTSGSPATVTFSSTGMVDSGFLQAKRKINYSVQPGNQAAGNSMSTFVSEPNMDNIASGAWGSFSNTANPGTSTVTASVPETGGSTDEFRASSYYSNSALNLSDYWTLQGGYLSYDAQVKVKSMTEYFLGGLAFRSHQLTSSDNKVRGFNVSFMRFGSQDNDSSPDVNDAIPLELKYKNWTNFGSSGGVGPLLPDNYYIILWMDTGANNNPNNATPMEKIIAYKKLDATSGVFAASPAIAFSDGAETTGNFTVDAANPWARTTSDKYSGSYSWSRSAYVYSLNSSLTMASSVSFPSGSSPALNFWHRHSIGSSTARVEISTNGGGTWTELQQYTGNSEFDNSGGCWVFKTINLSAYAGQSNVKIRFRLTTGSSSRYNGSWYIDDVKILSNPRFTDWSTILVRLEEKNLTEGDNTTRRNVIRVYYSTPSSNGTGDHTTSYDVNRLGSNPIGTTNWPEATGSDPNFTLVQWDEVLTSYFSDATAVTAGENNTVVMTKYFRTNGVNDGFGAYTVGSNIDDLGLTVFGAGTSNNLFFDDLAICLGGCGGDTAEGNGDIIQY